MYVSKTLPVATAFALWTAAAQAQGATDAIISQYQDMGFQYIEIKEGITQTKVEAIMPDGRKVEVIYDNATGRILKQENERADAEELRQRGVDINQDDEDFLDDDEDDDDESNEADEDDEDDESDENDDDEDESDDDESDGSDESDESDESDDED